MNTDNKHTHGKWGLQGPKINEDFGKQTYYTIHLPGTYDTIGFLYPKSPATPEQMQADVDRIIFAVNNIDEAIEENKALREELRLYKNRLVTFITEIQLLG